MVVEESFIHERRDEDVANIPLPNRCLSKVRLTRDGFVGDM
jgi:hypothetical protein